MWESRFDSRPGVRSNEVIFLGRSPRKVCIQYLILGLIAASVAIAFAGSIDFRTWLCVERKVAPWTAALSGGAATVLFVCAAWTWMTRLRWVAVSPEGIRWLRGPRARHHRWDQYIGIDRGTLEWTVWGEDLRVGRYADVKFRTGPPLRISTHTINGYDELVADIQTTASEQRRLLFPLGGSHSGMDNRNVADYGPLRIHADGLEWDKKRFKWDEIQDYEVKVGYLRIEPFVGPEFLRRLTELGDWGPAIELLDKHVGPRLATKAQAVATAESEQSPAPEAIPSPC
jgi:hypothetical protein